MNKPTPEMIRAIEICKEFGSLVKYKGGYWQKPNDPLEGMVKQAGTGYLKIPLDYILPKTINAGIKYGHFKVTKTRYSKLNGRTVDIEVVLTSP